MDWPMMRGLAAAAGMMLASGCTLLPSFDAAALPAVPPAPPVSATEFPPARTAELCLAAAQEMEKNGHELDAIAQYEKARQNNPHLKQVARRLAVLYDRRGETTRAAAEYRAALETAPNDADLLNDFGYFHYQRGSHASAEEALRKALAIQPKLARAWGNLALVLAAQQRYEESAEAFGKVVTPAQARANVGILLAQHEKTAEAQLMLRQALEMEPDLKVARGVLDHLANQGAAAAALEATPALAAVE